MKQLLSLLLASSLLLCACGQTSTAPGSASGSAPVPSPAVDADLVQTILDGMTLEEKIYQLFLVTPESLTDFSGVCTAAGETTQQALQARPVGGLIYMAQNIQTPEQVTKMIENSQSYSKLGLFISVDEEGGTVSRIGANDAMDTTPFPPMGEIGNTADAYEVGKIIGTEIAALGFNLDYAPVADVFTNPANTVIGDRAFSTDAEEAADLVASCVKGFRDAGMLCTIKHFPGHGNTATDSHYGTASTDKTLDELRMEEFIPFEAGIAAGADLVMVGHITTPNATTDGLPASLSGEMVTDVLRDELGFDGLIVTDALDMQAITDSFSPAEAAVKALQAGNDLLLCPENLTEAVQGIRQAVEDGILPEQRIDESVRRILNGKMAHGILDETQSGS